jgi:hypothetical protein
MFLTDNTSDKTVLQDWRRTYQAADEPEKQNCEMHHNRWVVRGIKTPPSFEAMEVPMRTSQKERRRIDDTPSFSWWDYTVLILVSVSLLVFSGLMAVQNIASSLDK